MRNGNPRHSAVVVIGIPVGDTPVRRTPDDVAAR